MEKVEVVHFLKSSPSILFWFDDDDNDNEDGEDYSTFKQNPLDA